MSQSYNRIDVAGPPRRNQAGECRHQDHDHWRARHRNRIIRRDADQLGLQDPIYSERCRQSNGPVLRTASYADHLGTLVVTPSRVKSFDARAAAPFVLHLNSPIGGR